MPHRAPPRPAAAIRFRSRTGRIFAKKTIYLRRQTLRVMKTHLLALLSLFCIGTALAQTPRDERIARAVERMDDGDYDEAARLLESVLAADPKNFLANYETGYLLYMQERYEEAVEVLRRIKRKDYPPLYQLLGNAYDMAGDRKRAVKTYEKGLRENPDAGRLYLELGNIAYAERQYDRALACYRRGAMVDPAHPSNYRSLALLYAISTEPVWTLVWGELFMNLERGSGRTSAMSETLAQTYRDNIRIEGDTAVRMTFSRNGRVAREGLRLRIPFGTAVFEVAARAALTADGIPDSLTLDVLSDMRERFVDRYFEKYDRMLFDDDAARPLMDYQRQVKEAGMMRPYNYWVLSQGFPDEFRQWRDEHAVQWQDFIAWFAAHPMSVPDPAAGRRNP